MVWLLVLALLFALLVAVFALQNATAIGIQFFTWRVEVSPVLVVLLSATAGAVTVGVAALFQRIRLGRRVRHLEGRVRELEQALKAASARSGPPQVAPHSVPPATTPEPSAREGRPDGGASA